MSFLRHKKTQPTDEAMFREDATVKSRSLIELMSRQLVIPWRVALEQSPPPLHQPTIFCNRVPARTIES